MDAERDDVDAVRGTTRAARIAGAALRVRVDDDAQADRDIVDGAPHRPNPADELMADDDGRRRRMTGRNVDDLDVGAADSARLDLDEDLVRPGQRVGDVAPDEPALPLENGGTHQVRHPSW
jgi:hypothetical protein